MIHGLWCIKWKVTFIRKTRSFLKVCKQIFSNFLNLISFRKRVNKIMIKYCKTLFYMSIFLQFMLVFYYKIKSCVKDHTHRKSIVLKPKKEYAVLLFFLYRHTFARVVLECSGKTFKSKWKFASQIELEWSV